MMCLCVRANPSRMVLKEQEDKIEMRVVVTTSTDSWRFTMKHLIVVSVMIAAMAVAAPAARANNILIVDPFLIPGSVGISAVHTDPLAFMDTFKFTSPGNFLAGTSLISISINTTDNIDFTAVTLNTMPVPFANVSSLSYAFTLSPLAVTAPIVLLVFGTTSPSTSLAHTAAYGGNLTVSSIPEPASLMLLGAGLAGIGIWRRKSTKS